MASNELLGVYLTDHLAGATAGIELAERLASDNQGTPLGAVMTGLVREIQEDRAFLEELMGRLGIDRSPVKQAAGWVFEKLSRVRMNKQLTGSAALSRLLEIETLSLGVEGKLAMWRALQELAAADAELAATDFDRLVGRAREQRQTLEPHRLQAAAQAFSP
jgi:hypothetical protein